MVGVPCGPLQQGSHVESMASGPDRASGTRDERHRALGGATEPSAAFLEPASDGVSFRARCALRRHIFWIDRASKPSVFILNDFFRMRMLLDPLLQGKVPVLFGLGHQPWICIRGAWPKRANLLLFRFGGPHTNSFSGGFLGRPQQRIPRKAPILTT